MTTRHVPNPGPHISTPLTNRLFDQLEQYARRDPNVIDTVQRVRSGDDTTLSRLIRQLQAGDQEAAVIALAALVPILTKLVLRRFPKAYWATAVDDYLTIAHITLAEARFTGQPTKVLGKVIARTRRRYARRFENRNAGVIPVADLTLTADSFNLERAVIARLTLDELTAAVHAGQLAPNDWEMVRAIAVEEGPTGKMTGADRQRLWRARQALGQFRDWRVAA